MRPGKPNAAASGFFSNIIREPLAGREAVLPVIDDVGQTHASPRATTEFLLHGATLDSAKLGARRTVMMPGVRASVADRSRRSAAWQGDSAGHASSMCWIPPRWRWLPDGPRCSIPHALALGFQAEPDFDPIIHAHIEDDLDGVFVR